MATKKTFMEESTAPGTVAGFDYQFHYFLYRLFNMKKGQSIGLEMKDDVHTDMDNDVQLFFQLKHTIQTQAGGNPIALAELDSDLWKTLYNWACVISDPKDGRAETAEQLTFVRRTEFHLVSNKSESDSNKFGQLLSFFTEHPCSENLKAVIDRIEGLAGSTKDMTIKGYIDTVLGLQPQVREEFLRRVFFQQAAGAIVQKIKDSLLEKFVHPERIDSTYQRLHALIRDDNYFSILAGTVTAIKFDDFATRYRKVISPSDKQTLSRHSFHPVLPKNLLDQRFIRQLIAIDDFPDTDTERITMLSTHRVRMARSLEVWVQGGEVVSDEVQALHQDVSLRWGNRHHKAFRKCPPAKVNDRALEIVDAMRDENYRLGDDELNTEQSNGELYVLSEQHAIGWHPDWKTL
ncbi:hypothetical protein EC919_114117 [Pseudomonas graminis]|uniref:hypothetical protein n=1 Tax=Pseudomonas graminis TaxID=158627 RepID=UPI001061450E|nr:hypothetical protein [Pseudomonas graminis]TDV44445.1 hypothetical protein EC919_114117 [Pseudomonas graminis]